jgi:hypothetical protein
MNNYTSSRKDGYRHKTSNRRKNKDGERRNFMWVWNGRPELIALFKLAEAVNPSVALNGFLGGKPVASVIANELRSRPIYESLVNSSRTRTHEAVISKVRGRMQKVTTCASTDSEHWTQWRLKPWGKATKEEILSADLLVAKVLATLKLQGLAP